MFDKNFFVRMFNRINNQPVFHIQKLHSKKLIHKRMLLLLVISSIMSSMFTNLGSHIGNLPAQGQNDKAFAQSETLTNLNYLPIIGKETADWPTVAGNPQRTSWTREEVYGNLHVEWYRPIEAYIPQNVQVIASQGKLFISTARGLYTLNSENGEVIWRYDTELPLGNSPTVSGNVVYVGGYDRKIHALDVNTGNQLWEFVGAGAGYDANPLVVEGKVIVGNRDGNIYAIGAQNTPQRGQLLWNFKTGGPIHFAAAYLSGIVYIVSDDNHAYALQADNGELVWKSEKLPGDGFHSHWPVIFEDKLIIATSLGYRHNMEVGTRSVLNDEGQWFDSFNAIQLFDLFHDPALGDVLGPEVAAQDWAHGYPVIDASRVTEYLEDNPDGDPYKHKPWRRTIIILNRSDGTEYTFDSDQDGYPEYAPFGYWGSKSGNRYPPVVGPDGVIYENNPYQATLDSQGRVMGWKIGTQYLSVLLGQAAIAEPQALSMGGNLIYRNLCCDRVGDYFDIRADGIRRGSLWSYNLVGLAPGYDEMWTILPGWPRLHGWFDGKLDTINSVYHNHGDQNPIVPYMGNLYVHRSNAIIAFGSGPSLGKLPLIEINPVQEQQPTLTVEEIRSKLEFEVSKILEGHLRPGYYNAGQFAIIREFANYFENPGDTLFTLARAYPFLSPTLQEQTRLYLQKEFETYFDPMMSPIMGWSEGAAREAMPLPPEVEADLANHPTPTRSGGFSWEYPQHNFYAMWHYAKILPEVSLRAYELAKDKIEVPVLDITDEYFLEKPYEHNAYIAGYIGFLGLQELAGMSGQDQLLRQQVTDELNRLLQLKASIFTKDSYWGPDDFRYRKLLDIARNFIFLVPELGAYMNQNMFANVQAAMDEYEYLAQFWFVARYESVIGEGVMSNLYNYHAMFQAKAYILKEPQNELIKYLDVPAFERGDLFYIQNLIAVLEAQP